MIKLKPWQWIVLSVPLLLVILFVGTASAIQIHAWGVSWIWAIIGLTLLGWRWLVVRWLQPAESDLDALANLDVAVTVEGSEAQYQEAEIIVQSVLKLAREDVPPWNNWLLFFQRAQSLVEKIAQVYHPTVKRPLLNIYVPQAYGLLRGTVDDVDRWMQKLSPVLGKVSMGQAYEAYEVYQRYEPAAKMAYKAWRWAQWVLNPAVAIARMATSASVNQANQQLVVNLGQVMRETTLKALGERAIALYSGNEVKIFATVPEPEVLPTQTQSLQTIIAEALPEEAVKTAPVQVLLAGRTGAGKSSLMNTIFRRDVAEVDVLPSTDALKAYPYQGATQEELILWDAPGYEQAGQAQYREQVLNHALDCDLLLLVTPALDPALQMDLEFLEAVKAAAPNLPMIGVVTQVDRLRPFREWSPPYDWREGDRPKETSIREAVIFRQETLGHLVELVLPFVTAQATPAREAWGLADLSDKILDLLDPAKQFRLARFLRDRDSRIRSAAKIIDQYVLQMSTTQGLTALLKSPILGFLSTLMTGSPQLATILAAQLPIEEAPVVLGKLQMAFDLYGLLGDDRQKFDLMILWPLVQHKNDQSISRQTWALGQTLVEFWLGRTERTQLGDRYADFLQKMS
jgi:uncharacterized protein